MLPNRYSPSQLLFRYTDTNTGGTVKKSTTELTSSQNHSLSLAAINWKVRRGGEIHASDAAGADVQVQGLTRRPKYSRKKMLKAMSICSVKSL